MRLVGLLSNTEFYRVMRLIHDGTISTFYLMNNEEDVVVFLYREISFLFLLLQKLTIQIILDQQWKNIIEEVEKKRISPSDKGLKGTN